MKKKFIILSAVVFGLIGVFAVTNSAIAAQTTKSTSGKATKAQLDKLAREMLKAAKAHPARLQKHSLTNLQEKC